MKDTTPGTDPYVEYGQRLDARRAEAARLSRLDRNIGTARLLTFLVGVGIGWFAIRSGLLSTWWLALPVLVFIGLVFFHERVRRLARLAQRGVAFYERGIARLEDRWSGQGTPGTDFLDSKHPYAQDLDLFGPGSLFELLCTTRTRGGEGTLAEWLRTPASLEEIRERQEAVEELRSALDLREQLALRGEEMRSRVHPEQLVTWAEAPALLELRRERAVAATLVSLTLATLGGWAGFGLHPLFFLVALAVQGMFAFRLRARVLQVIVDVTPANRDLRLLAEVLACFEAEHFTCPRLVALRTALATKDVPPSQQIERLGRLINLLESRNNQLFIPIAALLLWTTQIALAIEAWRRISGPAVARWLAAIGELEALGSLAGYAYEHPADPFPEVVGDGPRFEGEGLGHPLIADAHCVRNDVRLGAPVRVLIVSGSNMSGKSTLLRTVGVNAVLALAGAPVRARRLRISPLALGATVRILDSLQAGSSHFYAEIIRLRVLMDLAQGPQPLLFLLDEIFHGTNSHDRQIGAEAIIRGFIKRGALGLVTTHDLALTGIADASALQAANVCFEDQLENGQLRFDYRMRPGVVQKSNALALMRAVGLEV
jgi:MutS domain V